LTREEAILVLLSILRQPDEEAVSVRRPLPSAQEWPEILACADEQGVAPFLYAHLKRTGAAKAAPEPILRELQQRYHQNSARNLQLFHELNAILDQLAIVQSSAIILKGAFLASTIYANPAMRSMGDLDILMHPGASLRAVERLRDLGYRPVFPPWVNAHGQVRLAAHGCMADLEIHWDFPNRSAHCRIPAEPIWKTAVPLEVAGCRALSLAPEEFILHLCYHTTIQHLLALGVRFLLDVDQTMRHYGEHLDWNRLAALASAWGLQKPVSLTLQLCQQQLGTPVPAWVIEQDGFANIDPAIMQDALKQISSEPGVIDLAVENLVQVQNQQGWLSKAKMFAEFVFWLPDSQLGSSQRRNLWTTVYFMLRRVMYLIGRYSVSTYHRFQTRKDASKQSSPKWRLAHWLYS
jgi:hypothetical protein